MTHQDLIVVLYLALAKGIPQMTPNNDIVIDVLIQQPFLFLKFFMRNPDHFNEKYLYTTPFHLGTVLIKLKPVLRNMTVIKHLLKNEVPYLCANVTFLC